MQAMRLGRHTRDLLSVSNGYHRPEVVVALTAEVTRSSRTILSMYRPVAVLGVNACSEAMKGAMRRRRVATYDGAASRKVGGGYAEALPPRFHAPHLVLLAHCRLLHPPHRLCSHQKRHTLDRIPINSQQTQGHRFDLTYSVHNAFVMILTLCCALLHTYEISIFSFDRPFSYSLIYCP
jgi:hypothetical protein